MKKTLAALAVLGAFAGTAAAADVTLYGVVDTGLMYSYSKSNSFTANGDDVNKLEMSSGVNSGSRFGLKGTEDLGNGIKIGFRLENGFSSDDGTLGQGGRLFGREAQVSVYTDYGTLSLGRMGALGGAAGTYDIIYAIGDSFDGGDEFVFGMPGTDRFDNLVVYQTPQFAGLQVTGMYSFKKDSSGQGTEGTFSSEDRYAGLSLTGEYGPAQFVLAGEMTKYGYNGAGASRTLPDDAYIISLGGNYNFEVVQVFAMAQYFKNLDDFTVSDEDTGFGLTPAKGYKGYSVHLGAIAPIAGGDLTVGAYYTDGSAEEVATGVDADLTYYGLAARYCYPLSERTTIYVGGGYGEVTADKYDAAHTQDAEYKLGGVYVGLDHHF
ncbi:porin [Sutterella sp.]|uniref:porin n=1 Tax=Sutterella sp. TaxID=1981025 RepID=UPI0026E04A9B|nr:porin [Sutterella sp.]MDO5531029.1 porin [Sutterella sp.]